MLGDAPPAGGPDPSPETAFGVGKAQGHLCSSAGTRPTVSSGSERGRTQAALAARGPRGRGCGPGQASGPRRTRAAALAASPPRRRDGRPEDGACGRRRGGGGGACRRTPPGNTRFEEPREETQTRTRGVSGLKIISGKAGSSGERTGVKRGRQSSPKVLPMPMCGNPLPKCPPHFCVCVSGGQGAGGVTVSVEASGSLPEGLGSRLLGGSPGSSRGSRRLAGQKPVLFGGSDEWLWGQGSWTWVGSDSPGRWEARFSPTTKELCH